jgi:hypothetical protein
MAAHRCPNCGLVNPTSAIACDCGYRFATGSIGQSYVPPSKAQQPDSFGTRVATRIAARVVSVLLVTLLIVAFRVCAHH